MYMDAPMDACAYYISETLLLNNTLSIQSHLLYLFTIFAVAQPTMWPRDPKKSQGTHTRQGDMSPLLLFL